MKRYLSTFIVLFLVATVLAYTSEIRAMEIDSDEHTQDKQEKFSQKWLDILLCQYVQEGDAVECEKLLQLGANPLATVNYVTPQFEIVKLFKFKYRNRVAILEAFLKYIDINAQNKAGITLLFQACEDSPEMVDLLLKKECDPTIEDCYGCPPLTAAIYTSSVDTVATLLQHGAPTNTDSVRFQPLIIAATHNVPIEILKVLLDHDANPFYEEKSNEFRDNTPRTALGFLNKKMKPTHEKIPLDSEDEKKLHKKKKKLLEKAENHYRILTAIGCINKHRIYVPRDIKNEIALAIKACNKQDQDKIEELL